MSAGQTSGLPPADPNDGTGDTGLPAGGGGSSNGGSEAGGTPPPPPAFNPLDPTVDFADSDDGGLLVIGRSRKRPPVFEPDLNSQQVAGGGWSVGSYAERNRIPHDFRVEGITTCYIKPDRTLWRLVGGTRNAFWVLEQGVSALGSISHEALTGLQGGVAGEHFHLSAADHAALQALINPFVPPTVGLAAVGSPAPGLYALGTTVAVAGLAGSYVLRGGQAVLNTAYTVQPAGSAKTYLAQSAGWLPGTNAPGELPALQATTTFGLEVAFQAGGSKTASITYQFVPTILYGTAQPGLTEAVGQLRDSLTRLVAGAAVGRNLSFNLQPGQVSYYAQRHLPTDLEVAEIRDVQANGLNSRSDWTRSLVSIQFGDYTAVYEVFEFNTPAALAANGYTYNFTQRAQANPNN